MNIREQEYILAIAKHGNIKNAARELKISSSGLSVFLSSLESKTGAFLFHRLGKKFVPTEAGALYIGYAGQISEFKKNYEAKLSDIKHGVSGTIRIGLHPRRTTFMIPGALKAFSAAYPEINVTVDEGTSQELYDNLLAGELDLIVINRKSKDSFLTYEWLYSDRLVCVLPSSHLLIEKGRKVPGETLDWMDLKLFDGENFILQTPPQSSRLFTDMVLRFSGVRPGKIFVIKNLETASQLAAEGLGIAFNLKSYTRNFTYPKPVKYFLAGDLNFYIHYWLVRRKDKYMPKYTYAFIDALKESMNEERQNTGGVLPHNYKK